MKKKKKIKECKNCSYAKYDKGESVISSGFICYKNPNNPIRKGLFGKCE